MYVILFDFYLGFGDLFQVIFFVWLLYLFIEKCCGFYVVILYFREVLGRDRNIFEEQGFCLFVCFEIDIGVEGFRDRYMKCKREEVVLRV